MDDTKKAVLLPCPFCGNPPKSGDSTYGYWLIFCSDENNCLTQPSVELKTEAEAIAAWNTRQPQTDALKAAREALEHIKLQATSPKEMVETAENALAALKESK